MRKQDLNYICICSDFERFINGEIDNNASTQSGYRVSLFDILQLCNNNNFYRILVLRKIHAERCLL